MSAKRKMTARSKKEIMIAVLLAACLLLGTSVMLLIEDIIGTPTFYDGEMKNIKVQFTEICSANKSILATDAGDFPDYIEIYNAGETFNLAGFGLSTESDNSINYTFGNYEFTSGSYLVLYLDGTNIPFRLNSDGGEYIALISYDGTVIDSATTVASGTNKVMLRTDDGYILSDEASPGYPNTPEGVQAFINGATDGSLALTINEILSSNESVLPDFEGDYCDIIEIKNISSAMINTSGYYVSDSIEDRLRCALPSKDLAPGDVMLIFASGKDTVSDSGEYHADFKLSLGETVVISRGAKHYSQEVVSCSANYSQSLYDGEYTEMLATPGFENDEAGLEAFEASRIYADAPLVINEILFSQDQTPLGGKLRDVIELCNISDSEISTKGWFISDSTDDPYRFALPDITLAPGECLLLYAEDGVGENICGFALSSRDSLYLTSPDYRRSEFVTCTPAGTGNSRSRVVENGEIVYINGEITLGYANSETGRTDYLKSVRPKKVELSEAVAVNNKYLAGPYKTYHDFIELHNRTSENIELTGWYISDDIEEPRKGSLAGVTVPANGYVVIILSNDGVNIPSGYHWVDFALSSSGETLCLSYGDEIIDSVILPSLAINTSYGRANGEDGFSVLASVTAGKANSGTAPVAAADPVPSIAQGVYDEASITVALNGEGRIYYTLDCTEPSASSTLYTEPLELTSTTVIRCIAIAEGKPKSNIVDLSYIINEPDTVEVVSLVTEPDNLWNYYTGIYATGPNAESTFPYNHANYYNRWEREATVTFFDKYGGGFSENCGIRIFGGLSRALAKKSFAVFFRASYGAGELNYQLFEDDELAVYEALVLRNTGQDYKYTSFRDAMITSMAHAYLNIDVQNCRPVVLYLNGEYWGFYFIREKLNENYVAGHYNVDASEAQVAVANGHNNADYKALVDYAWTHDLSDPEHYEYVCSLMDVENYCDYIVAEIIIANTDNGNIRFFTYEGGKWRWIMYDVDQSFRSVTDNTVLEHLNPNGTGGGNNFSTRLINSLLKNPDFKKMFLEEIAYQLNNVWTVENVSKYVDEFASTLKEDIRRDYAHYNKSFTQWESSVKGLKTFIEKRESYMIKYVKSYFSLSDSEMRAYGFNV